MFATPLMLLRQQQFLEHMEKELAKPTREVSYPTRNVVQTESEEENMEPPCKKMALSETDEDGIKTGPWERDEVDVDDALLKPLIEIKERWSILSKSLRKTDDNPKEVKDTPTSEEPIIHEKARETSDDTLKQEKSEKPLTSSLKDVPKPEEVPRSTENPKQEKVPEPSVALNDKPEVEPTANQEEIKKPPPTNVMMSAALIKLIQSRDFAARILVRRISPVILTEYSTTAEDTPASPSPKKVHHENANLELPPPATARVAQCGPGNKPLRPTRARRFPYGQNNKPNDVRFHKAPVYNPHQTRSSLRRGRSSGPPAPSNNTRCNPFRQPNRLNGQYWNQCG